MLKISGKVMGVRRKERTNKNKSNSWTEYFLGFSSLVENGYANETAIQECKLPKAAVDSGVERTWNDLKGQNAEVAIFVSSRIWEERVYIDYIATGTAQPLGLPLKKAS